MEPVRSAPERLRVGGDVLDLRVGSAETDGAVLAYDVTLAPGGGPPHLHRHAAIEVVRVEDGEVTFYLGTEAGIDRRLSGVGDVVCIAGGREHTFRNESAEAARVFALLSPGRQMEDFARAAAALGAEASPDQVARLATTAGIEITRPLEGAVSS
jgi:quercetin dioxygenase-like cupin family protein